MDRMNAFFKTTMRKNKLPEKLLEFEQDNGRTVIRSRGTEVNIKIRVRDSKNLLGFREPLEIGFGRWTTHYMKKLEVALYHSSGFFGGGGNRREGMLAAAGKYPLAVCCAEQPANTFLDGKEVGILGYLTDENTVRHKMPLNFSHGEGDQFFTIYFISCDSRRVIFSESAEITLLLRIQTLKEKEEREEEK